MRLGIKPTVDFAFKKIFGTPENAPVLLGLVNAVLQLVDPLVDVEILNPFSYQDFEDDKLIVLDIRARDAAGRWLKIEMQVSVYPGLLQRLAYYACTLPGEVFQRAITVLETIAARTEDRQMYDRREKAQRDYQWAIDSVREEGWEKGREEGLNWGVTRAWKWDAKRVWLQLSSSCSSCSAKRPGRRPILSHRSLEELNSLQTEWAHVHSNRAGATGCGR